MLEGILAISGEPGLYKMVSQTKTGIIVESIETKKRIPAYATNKISSLEDIAIFTEVEEVPLKEVFKSIKTNTKVSELIANKMDNNLIKSCFKEILPEYDEDRVYISDMKKVFKWYNILDNNDLLKEDTPKEDHQSTEE